MGKNPLEEMGVAHIVNKRVQKAVLAFQKWQSDLGSFPRKTIQYYSNPSLCPSHDAEEAEVELFYEDLQDLLAGLIGS